MHLIQPPSPMSLHPCLILILSKGSTLKNDVQPLRKEREKQKLINCGVEKSLINVDQLKYFKWFCYNNG